MAEFSPPCVKGGTGKGKGLRRRHVISIQGIAQEGMSQRRHMHADLVGTPCFQPEAYQRPFGRAVKSTVVRDGRFMTGRICRSHFQRIIRVSSHRQGDRMDLLFVVGGQISGYCRQIFFAKNAADPLALKYGSRRAVFGKKNDSGSFSVKASHRTAADGFSFCKAVRKYLIGNRIVIMASGRMHRYSRRFVYSDKSRIFIENIQGRHIGGRGDQM